jgi:hypothetical protein
MATQSIFNMTDTWNAGATTFTAVKMNVTDTASAAASLLFDVQVGGVSQFSIKKTGAALAPIGTAAAPSYAIGQADTGWYSSALGSIVDLATGGVQRVRFSANGFFMPVAGSAATVSSDGAFSFSSGTAGAAGTDTFLTRAAAASLRLGQADAASPVAQTLVGQGSRAGTDTNVGGANLTIRPGNGTGTGTLSTLILQSPVAVGSGTGAQTQTTGLTINAGTAVMTSYLVANLPAAATAGAGARAFVTNALAPVFGSAVAGGGAVGVPVYSTGAAWNVG